VLRAAKRLGTFLAAILLWLPAQSIAQKKSEPVDSVLQGKLQEMADARAAAGKGKIALYAVQLKSGGSGAAIASKTGSLDDVRVDVAIVMGKAGPMVLSIFTYDNQDHGWTVDNEAEVTIAKVAKEIVTAWSPEGIDGKLLAPGLGLEARSAPAPR
jgi:hypothetical protein